MSRYVSRKNERVKNKRAIHDGKKKKKRPRGPKGAVRALEGRMWRTYIYIYTVPISFSFLLSVSKLLRISCFGRILQMYIYEKIWKGRIRKIPLPPPLPPPLIPDYVTIFFFFKFILFYRNPARLESIRAQTKQTGVNESPLYVEKE